MAIFKCKMCGGSLDVMEGMSVCECEFCGSQQTVPSLDNEKKINLFTRANRLRSMCEFDKAYGVYESIVTEFPEEAEAYWGLILCKYGIEYVDDPKTGNKIPTCHRSSFESVMDNPNIEMVMEYSDSISRSLYRKEVKVIEELRSRIIEVSSKEQPYDIFICYKETDVSGNRTIDSVIAQDVYDALTEKGYRVFFSRISLEDKLGQEYEPYIFSALNSAKIMLVLGTDYEYFNAVWVKNEWSRFLSLIEKGEKKTIIPCFKGIDAYDMPKEFARLQAQDMGKVGAIQDLLHGIKKILPKDELNQQIAVKQSVMQAVPFNSNVDNLLKRVVLFLENGEWESATDYCNKALDQNSECAMAYLYLFMSEMKLKREEELDFWIYAKHCKNNRNLNLAFRFADYTLKNKFENYNMCFEKNKNQVITTLTQYFEQRLKKNRRGGLERYLNFAKGQITAIENTILKTESSIESVNINELQQQFENTNSQKNITISEYSTIHGRITSLESELSKMTILQKKKKERLMTEITELKKQKCKLFVKSQELKATTIKLQKSIENCISEKKHIVQLKENKDKLVNEINDIQNQINKLTIEIQNIPNVTEQEYENAKEKFIEFPIDVLSHLPDNFLFNISEEFFSQLPKDFISAFSEEDLSKIPINVRIRAGMKCVKFGKYEWHVISLSSINATLLCKDIVCQKAYNDKLEEITWENCTLRSWLNNDFYNEFNDTEKARIVKTRCKNNNENDTEDYIFIYTLERAESIDKSIRCCNTWWWLRSPGHFLSMAAGVNSDGDLDIKGNFVDNKHGVRPVLRISV